MTDSIRVNSGLRIPMSEIRLTFSTSSGPGGQHANKVATRVDLTWDVSRSQALGPRQRERIMSALGRRIDSHGILHLSSDRYRSQMRNREDVLERFRSLVTDALRPRKRRRPTAPTRASRERRLAEKRRRSEIKRGRRAVVDD